MTRHDHWKSFCTEHAELLGATALPAAFIRSETRFRDLMQYGHAGLGSIRVTFGQLSSEQWAAFSRLADRYCEEFESYDPLTFFPELGRERARRGSH
jgi:hypothetical protein